MAEVSMRVAAHLWPSADHPDGRTIEASGVWAGLSDRVAFESKFDVAWNVHVRALLAAIREKRDDPELREDRGAFMAWRLLRRAYPADQALAELDVFLEATKEVDLERLDLVVDAAGERVDASLDPTEPTPPTPPSPPSP